MKNLRQMFLIISTVFMLPVASCASADRFRHVDRTLHLCRQLLGPDAEKADGEVWFWLQSERADVSRKLWNDHGLKAIEERLAVVTSEVDRQCLLRLRKEAVDREVVQE